LVFDNSRDGMQPLWCTERRLGRDAECDGEKVAPETADGQPRGSERAANGGAPVGGRSDGRKAVQGVMTCVVSHARGVKRG